MELPVLEFWFDYGCCLWNSVGAVNAESLPISEEFARELNELGDKFAEYLDWSDPHNPPVWSREETLAFFDRAELVCKRLQEELRGKYTVINRLDRDREDYADPEAWIDDRK